jgi:hypothetical protein
VLHDWWLALVASIFGRIETIAERTVLYRQHTENCLGATSYDWQYVMRRAMKMLFGSAATECFQRSRRQAVALLRRFATSLNPGHREVIGAFVNLKSASFLDRRWLLLKHGFLGSGRLRNLGWLMMI